MNFQTPSRNEFHHTGSEKDKRKKNWQALWFVGSYILRKSTFFPLRTEMNAFLHSHMAMKKTDSGSNQCGWMCMCEGSVTCFRILDIKGKVNIQQNTGRLTFLHTSITYQRQIKHLIYFVYKKKKGTIYNITFIKSLSIQHNTLQIQTVQFLQLYKIELSERVHKVSSCHFQRPVLRVPN